MKTRKLLLFLGTAAAAAFESPAANPVIWTKFTADPAPLAEGDTLYLYTSHDEDDAEGFKMRDWLLYSTKDMVNYTDLGSPASLKSIPYFKGDNGAWAIQVVKRNGKYYMYCPLHGQGIVVLVADRPEGPFKDVLGKQLVWRRENWYDIDPTILVDDDGQAYMYWGNPECYMAKLNEDMVSLSGEITTLPKIRDYQEGPWAFKRDGLYYLAYASTCCPEGIGYATSRSPLGPWEYRGDIMPHTHRSRGNHPGVVEFKGRWYLFGFNYDMHAMQCEEKGEKCPYLERRSIHVADLEFGADGAVKKIDWWNPDGVKQIKWLDPYVRVEAETMAKAKWVKTRRDQWRGMVVTDVQDGDFTMVQGVDFGRGADCIEFDACPNAGGIVELRLDKADGKLVGKFAVRGATGEWKTVKAKVSGAAGVHDLYFMFKGEKGVDLFDADCWKMHETGGVVPPKHEWKPGENPILHDRYTADPSPLVVGDTLYLYCGRDEARDGEMFTMTGWLVYSTKDALDWKYEGVAARPEEIAHGLPGSAWAAQCIERDGTYFLYVTHRDGKRGGQSISVLESKSPKGPFKDAKGEPVVTDAMTPHAKRGWNDIDPTVFVDDDGQAYLGWGNGEFYIAKLKRNMRDLDGEIRKIDLDNYVEGPWLFKRGEWYYIVYPSIAPGQGGEHMSYAMAKSVMGPWTSKGEIMDNPPWSFTIHPGVIEFKGQWYMFYHNQALPRIPAGGSFLRSVCVEKFDFNADGTIPYIPMKKEF